MHSIFNVKSDFLGTYTYGSNNVKMCYDRVWTFPHKFAQQELDNMLRTLSFDLIKTLFCHKIRP